MDQKRFDADPDQDTNLYFDADQDPEPIIDTVMTNFKCIYLHCMTSASLFEQFLGIMLEKKRTNPP